MQKTVKTTDLKTGMYVILPSSGVKHSFSSDEFLIKSRDQIKTILELGVPEVVIDPERGAPVVETEFVGHALDRRGGTVPKKWDPDKFVPPELREAVRDAAQPPERRARLVYQSALQLMERLFEDPNAGNIGAAKKGIAEIVDLVLSDDATAGHLLKVTSNDFHIATHSVNVGVRSILLSKAIFKGSDAHNMHELGAGFFLHDIGKVRVDPAITFKQGKLTEPEMTRMRAHTLLGNKLLSEANQLTRECDIIVMQHHERENGAGYPRGLKGDEIHAYGRIGSIADVFDAITAERPYKLRIDAFQALKLMKEELLDHFHPEIFEKFVMLFAEHVK